MVDKEKRITKNNLIFPPFFVTLFLNIKLFFFAQFTETKDGTSVEYECKADSSSTMVGNTRLKVKDKIRFRVDTGSDGIAVQVDYYNKIDEDTIDPASSAKESKKSSDDEGNVVDTSSETKSQKDDDTDKKDKDEKDNENQRRSLQKVKKDTKTTYGIKYTTLIEYRKGSNSTLGEEYDFDNDKVVQTIPLTDWVDFSDIQDDIVSGQYSTFATRTTDGMVTLNFTINRGSEDDSEDTTTTTTSKGTVNKMKIDITIENFPWKRNNTYVALLSNVQSGRQIKTVRPKEDDEDGPFVQASSEGEAREPPKPRGPAELEKVTKQVDISFYDAIDATSGFVTFGEYTWDSYAKVSKKKVTPSEANITDDIGSNTTTIDGTVGVSPSSNDT